MLVKAHIQIIGTRPYLFNCLGIGFLSSDRKKMSGQIGNNPDEWQNTFYMNEQRVPYIPSSYVLACLREGSTYSKSGRGSLQKKLTATLFVEEETILFKNIKIPKEEDIPQNDVSKKIYIDVRSVRNPATKGRNLRYRLCIAAGWEFDFTIIWDDTIISETQMRNIVRDGGTLGGISDGRRIGFGRFEVKEFKILK
jgi:hypothetical protein